MSNLMAAHNQWINRPADERFWGLDDLLAHSREDRLASRETRTAIGDIRAEAVQVAGYDSPDLRLVAGEGDALNLSHWSFGQLCSAADAPASYLRRLRADLAAENINNGLRRAGTGASLQFLANVEAGQVRSITRDYSRLWNADLISALTPALDLGWRVPPARPAVDDPRARPATQADILSDQGTFGLSVKLGDLIAPAGVYAGDRDLFVFLVAPDRVIDDGNKGLMRGVFLWNSEVGAGSFKVRTFYLENVCGNHICWNASHLREVKVRHRGDRILTADREMVT